MTPDSHHPVAAEERLIGDQAQVLGLCLSNQHAAEEIAMERREQAGPFRVVRRDRSFTP